MVWRCALLHMMWVCGLLAAWIVSIEELLVVPHLHRSRREDGLGLKSALRGCFPFLFLSGHSSRPERTLWTR